MRNGAVPSVSVCLLVTVKIKWQPNSMLNTSLAQTHCLLICTKYLQMDESKGDGGCVVRSSHCDVKQAHAEAPPL